MAALEDGQAADGDFFGSRRLGDIIAGVAPKLCLHAGNQLKWVEGLGDVIIRAEGKTGDLIHILHLCSQHDDGKEMLFPDLPAEREAVHIGQHHIQNGKGKLLLLRAEKGFRGAVKFTHLKAFVLQINLDEVCNFLFVIDN